MTVAEQIEKLRGYPSEASDAFKQQLEQARLCREQMEGYQAPVRGIDRSGELTPIARPTIVRAVAETK
jgi:hypothetical protein